MNKLIPILPCDNIQTLVEFYVNLGFECDNIYTSPNAYAVLKYQDIELHFFGNRRFIPSENPYMCILQVDDVSSCCNEFTDNLKLAYGKIPRTGIPKITKVRDLKDDRRFTLTDPGGNTIYVLTPNLDHSGSVFRTLDNENYKKDFAVLYDFIYSKEDKQVASNHLQKLLYMKDNLEENDLAKFLLVEIEITGLSQASASVNTLQELIEKNKGKNDFWETAEKKYSQLLQT